MESPIDDVTEQCFYHRLGEKDGRSMAGIYNKNLGIGFIYTFDKKVLDEFYYGRKIIKDIIGG